MGDGATRRGETRGRGDEGRRDSERTTKTANAVVMAFSEVAPSAICPFAPHLRVSSPRRPFASSLVIPNKPLGGKCRFAAAFNLNRRRPGDLPTACHVFDVLKVESRPYPLPLGNRRYKPQAVQPIVDPHLEVTFNLECARGKDRQKRKGKKPMRDRRPERRLFLRPLHVDVNPLVIFSRVGEVIYSLL